MRKRKQSDRFNWEIVFVIVFIIFMICTIVIMYLPDSSIVHNGKVNLSENDFEKNKLVELDGEWEFYWDRLLIPKDFIAEDKPQIDAFIKVPSSWNDKENKTGKYSESGVATYRLILKYPDSIKDPALKIKGIGTAYKLYANGNLIVEVGKVSNKQSEFKKNISPMFVDLPKDKQEIELIFQVANQDHSKGGICITPVFASKKLLVQEKMRILSIQMMFIGSAFIFSIYYFLLFILQRKNKTELFFSVFCFTIALRTLIWGQVPLKFFFPNVSYKVMLYISCITGYNLIPVTILFVISMYPFVYKKNILRLLLIPTFCFEALLLTPPEFMMEFNNSVYIVSIIQMIYILIILIKAVVGRMESSRLMLVTMGIFILSMIKEILNYKGVVSLDVGCIFMYGNFVLIVAMSFIQARQQANIHKKLILYNENLVEADRLKDKIMETEMSFLQAQIKPHFLYNALNAIANVCEKNGEKASNLIIDLSIYLRGSLEFNNLNKMATIEKELDFINTYFNIEQARFGEKIELVKEIEVPLDYKIPVLILQPLVENAVRHGISKKQVGGRVIVRIIRVPEGITVEIEDDGIGIEGKKLQGLLSKQGIDNGVGLLNIHNRLLRLYGSGLCISSKVGCGTIVKLVIPEGGTEL